ncbi:sensor domain-containing diguanylate cyclase [Cohnella silvisoli]|uniref:Sensor domain-containing diguanylate cyclase n=1 Tax=Cohnella silvisoli TaxID=2873699 RepID=A0ABV1KTV3_9BACL|nr:sensor domain-containing diguanylate cyclase [Cohnella silvisoli]MCD9022784.1 sensor domain-containing diguanylate cyclase [Cohnella silvisoli]
MVRIKRGFKLRSTVNALVLLTVLATLTISSFIAYRSEKQSLIRMTFQLNQVYTEKISETVNSLFDNMKQSLAVTGEYLATDLTRPDLHEQLLLFQRSNPSFNTVFIIDRNGSLVDASNAEPSNIGTKITSAGTQQALKEQRPLVSEPYMSKATNKLIVMVSQPLKDAKGTYLGFIGGSIRLHETNIFQTVLGSVPDQANGSYAYVVSSSGHLLYHPDPSRIGEDGSHNTVVRSLMAGESGTRRIVNTKGVDMLTSYSYIKEAGWGIVAQTPTEIVLTSARNLVMKIVIYMLPALLVFIAIIYWFVGKMSAPFSKLAQFASMLSPNQSGRDRLPRIHSWNYEANELHRAFGRAARHFRFQFDNLSKEAQTDPLTGLYNRRTLDQFIRHWIEQSIPFSMMVMDLDHFKQVNDTYGHEKGDEVLKFLSVSLQRLVGEGYVCCRFGGEEFVVLVPNEELDVALQDAEKIRRYMSETDSPTDNKVTLSIGVAHYPSVAHNAEQLFRLADEAMYRAKRLGRNRVEFAKGSEFEERTS